MELLTHRFELPLRHVFTISRESISVQETLVVELRQDGLSGFGEATTNRYYGVTFASMKAHLETVRSILADQSLEDPAELWEHLAPHLASDPFAQCALDQAAHDLWGKLRGKSVRDLWGLTADRTPPTDYTIGIDRPEVMLLKMQEFPDWPIYKIKLGTAQDLEIIQTLRQHTDAIFRVDANCGWTAAETIRNSLALRELNVEFLEQPLPADRWDEMKEVYKESALPLIADESCIVEADVSRCAGHFHGVNIKLCKCGGLTPARRMIEEARQLGMKVMVGCMTESSVGISAIAQLLPLLDYVDMDGALLLAQDIARGVRIDKGVCIYPDRPGCGVELTADPL
jgi:L-alanine-DL-glutamate epimerase-like enolase superfamily enzyme